MNNLFISPEAENDLDEIESYIGLDNPEAASEFVDKLFACFEKLAHSPRIGKKRDEIMPGLRSLTQRPYKILYLVNDNNVTIVRVLHGSRDIQTIFGLES